MGFLRTLLFIIVGFYLFRIVMRWLSPWLMKKAAQKMQAQAHAQQGGRSDGRSEGDIRVEYTNRTTSQPNMKPADDAGDYIDFEEIKD